MLRLPPHRFYIGRRLWRLRYGVSPNRRRAQGNFNSTTHAGWCDRKDAIIYISPTLRRVEWRDILWETFAHELLHACDWRASEKTIGRIEGKLGQILSQL